MRDSAMLDRRNVYPTSFAIVTAGSLNWNWLKHVVSVQLQGAAPERCLEDVVRLIALAVLCDRHKQSRPLERAQDTG